MDGRWLALVSLVGVSCRSHPDTSADDPAASWVAETVSDLGPVVARVGQNPVFAAEVRAQSERSGKPVREALEDLIRFHLLAERANDRGVASVRRSEVPRELLVQRLIEREFEPLVEPDDLSEVELRSLYERNKAKYVHPRMVRVALLSVYPRRGMPKETAFAVARETAHALFAEVSRRAGRSADDFAKIQQEPTWSSKKVQFARIWQGPDESFGQLAAGAGAAIARLRRPGDTNALLEDSGAYHIARYMEEIPAENVTYEQAREQIRSQRYPSWRREQFDRFTRRLADNHRVEAFKDRVLTRTAP